MTTIIPRVTDDRRYVLQRRIRWIVTATIAYNLIEAVVAIAAGTAASSAALIGFGLDSTIEVLSAAAVVWQFARRDPERWEKGTLRVIAVAFFVLAAYVTVTSVLALIGQVDVEQSTLGIVITALSVVIMPFLRSLSVESVASWDRPRPSRTRSRRSSAPTSPRPCWWALSSTACSVGGGPTRSPASSSPRSRSERASRHGGATPAPSQ